MNVGVLVGGCTAIVAMGAMVKLAATPVTVNCLMKNLLNCRTVKEAESILIKKGYRKQSGSLDGRSVRYRKEAGTIHPTINVDVYEDGGIIHAGAKY